MKHHLVIYDRQTLKADIDLRPDEHKLGQKLTFLKPGETHLKLASYFHMQRLTDIWRAISSLGCTKTIILRAFWRPSTKTCGLPAVDLSPMVI